MRRIPVAIILALAVTVSALAVGITYHLRMQARADSGLFVGGAIAAAVPADELRLLAIPGDERLEAFTRCAVLDARASRSALTDRALYVLDEQDAGGCRRLAYADIQLAAVLATAAGDRPMLVSFARRGGGVDDVAVLMLAAGDGPRFLSLLQRRGIEIVWL